MIQRMPAVGLLVVAGCSSGPAYTPGGFLEITPGRAAFVSAVVPPGFAELDEDPFEERGLGPGECRRTNDRDDPFRKDRDLGSTVTLESAAGEVVLDRNDYFSEQYEVSIYENPSTMADEPFGGATDPEFDWGGSLDLRIEESDSYPALLLHDMHTLAPNLSVSAGGGTALTISFSQNIVVPVDASSPPERMTIRIYTSDDGAICGLDPVSGILPAGTLDAFAFGDFGNGHEVVEVDAVSHSQPVILGLPVDVVSRTGVRFYIYP